jgi:hypothetical protein
MVSLTEGEKIEYFNLMGTGQEEVTADDLNRDKVALIFIFKLPCAPCNHNLTLWRRMAKILRGKVAIYGIWLGNHSEMFNFQENARLGFKIYAPLDINTFKRELRLNHNYAQTILYHNDRVEKIRLEKLDGNDYTTLLKCAKKFMAGK